MEGQIQFFVNGEPKGQPRARAFAMKRGNKVLVRMYDPSTAEGWKTAIAAAAKAHCPFPAWTGPVALSTTFIFPRPKSHFRTGRLAGILRPDAPKYHTGKPDRDNLEKAVMDALKMLGFYRDDSQVCDGDGPVRKIYGDRCGAQIVIRQIAAEAQPLPMQHGQEVLGV